MGQTVLQHSAFSDQHLRAPRPLAKQIPVAALPSSSARPGAQWIIGGVAIFAFTAYGTFLYQNYKRSVTISEHLNVPEDVADRYDHHAATFDQGLDFAEWCTGLRDKRKKMMAQAHGQVLEVAAGTGRNFEYYPWNKCRSLTVLDLSQPMLEEAKKKLASSRPKKVDVRFLVQDGSHPIPNPPPRGYDTITQTMGLCSTPDPVGLLQNLGREVNQQTGQILLLEHGRSYYQIVNTILDTLAPAHADKHGCWWNKDIGAIVEKSGLKIVESRRYDLGTTWWYKLRPSLPAVEH